MMAGAPMTGCGPSASSTVQRPGPIGESTTSRVRSFSDSRPITSLAAASGLVWAGTPRGLIRWSMSSETPTPTLLTTIDGLPADKIASLSLDDKGGVWVTTPKGVARYTGGSWTNYPRPPVGDLIAGIVASPDGESAWVGGSDALAFLRDGQWERYASGTTVTAMAGDGRGGVWIGTSGKGILRVVKDDLLTFGLGEGNDIDNVRALVADNAGALLAVGEGPGGQRVAFYDGNRFWSYKVQVPGNGVIEWVQRVGNDLYLGAGTAVWSMKRLSNSGRAAGPLRFDFSGTGSMGAPKAQPLKSLKPADEKPAAAAPAAPAPTAAPPPAAPAAPAKEAPAKGKKGKTKTGWLQSPSDASQPKMAAAQVEDEAPPRPVRTWLVAGPGGSGSPPIFDSEQIDLRLPDGVTTVASDGEALYVGTRFLGVSRITRGKQTPLRLFDLTAAAERLTIACASNNDCYVATGGTTAWRFDGQTFEVSDVDPEKGSHVLAVVRDPTGAVIALHRGASSKEVRISRVGTNGKWSPVGVTSLEVPSGVPDLSFASFSPRGQLWVGLRYVDKDQDARAFGAAEVAVDDGRVIYYRQRPQGVTKNVSQGVNIPIDVTAIAWKGPDEAWLASRSGAVRLQNSKTVKTFTENDGLESELVHDVVEGLGGNIWIATSRGIGVWDGQRWSFPKAMPYNAKATALARDPDSRVWIGTDKGVYEVVNEKQFTYISSRSGLLDDKVLNLGIDVRGRVWVLTEKGISVIEGAQASK
ncbi:MAG: hypothetical protein JNJ46_30810 [Myxococcales bacterium]|nr:hypothetical protein [Myxococcales bacterium]